MAADKFTLVGGQSEDEIYTENNYFSVDKSTLKAVNSKGKEVTKDWFKSVDYADITPTRNTDGSIDMHGLFELTDNAPEGIGAVISKTEDNICKEHKWDAGVVTKEATCTEAGEITYTCEVCKEKKTEVIAAKGHTYSTEWTVDKEATCTEAGSKSHHCTVCDAKSDETEIKAAGHKWNEGVVTKEATCTEAGEKTYTCEVCKETKTEVIAAKGHTYSTEWTVDKEATTTEPGSKSHHCIVCDVRADVTEIPVIKENETEENTGIDVIIDADKDVPGIKFNDSNDDLVDKILGDNEKAEADGKKIEVSLDVVNADNKITAEDKKLISDNLTSNQRTGVILDITLKMKIDNQSKQIYETNKEIFITTDIPENLINTDKSVERKYFVVRIHDGKLETLKSEYNADTNKLTFITDKFSIYAIVYEDISKNNNETTKPSEGATKPSEGIIKQEEITNVSDNAENNYVIENVQETLLDDDDSVQSGDNMISMELLMLIAVLSAGVIIFELGKKKRIK